ncbi:hypothetical protein B5S31_g2565 [[Candida] boidinii]|nr:hypothetical protein B5S31_g2565 [[Candida] boidinii]
MIDKSTNTNKEQQHKNPVAHSLFHSIQQHSHILHAQPPTPLHHNSTPAGTNTTTTNTEKDKKHTIDKHKENNIDHNHNHNHNTNNINNNNIPVRHSETISTLPKSLPKPSLLPSISFGSDESEGENADDDVLGDIDTNSSSKDQIKLQISKLETLQEKCNGEEEEEEEEEEQEDDEDHEGHLGSGKDEKTDDLSDSELGEIMDPARPKLSKEKLNPKLKKLSLVDKDNDDPETIKNTLLNSMLYDQDDKKKMEEEEEISRLMASPLLSPISSPPPSSNATSMSLTSSMDSSAIPFVSLDNISQQPEEKISTKKQVKSVSFDTLRNPNLTIEPRSFTLNSKHENYEYSRTSRTFLVGYDENECSFIALKWAIDKMIHDGDTLVCLRVITKEIFESPENSKKNYKKEGEEILKTILKLNKIKNKKIQIVLEFRIGRVADMISLTVKDYNPIILIVGTRGIQKSGFKSMISSKSMSKNCLQYSTIPVIVVNPNYQFIDTPSIPSVQTLSSSSSPLSLPATPPIQPASNVNIVEIKIAKDNAKKNKDSSGINTTTTTTTTTTNSDLHAIPLESSNNEETNSNSVFSLNSINSNLIEIPNNFEINFYKDRLFQFIDSELRKTVYAKFTDNEIRQINGFESYDNLSSNSLSPITSNGESNLLHPTESRTSRFNRMGSIKRDSSRDTSTSRTRSAFSPVRALSPFRLFKKN